MRLSLVLLLVALSGCTHTVSLGPERVDRFHRATEGSEGVVVLRNGERHDARNVRVSADSLSWFLVPSGEFRQAAASEVVEIVYRSRKRGTVDGFLIGVGINLALTSALQYAYSTNPRKWGLFAPHPLVVGAAGMGAVTSPSAGVGSVVGSRIRYRYTDPEP